MTNCTVAIETDSDDRVTDVKQIDDLRTGLDGYKILNDEYLLPITTVSVASLSSGKEGQKTR